MGHEYGMKEAHMRGEGYRREIGEAQDSVPRRSSVERLERVSNVSMHTRARFSRGITGISLISKFDNLPCSLVSFTSSRSRFIAKVYSGNVAKEAVSA